MRNRIVKAVALGSAVVAATALLGGAERTRAQEARPQEKGAPEKAQGKRGFPDMVQALKDSPGCLGVETARTGSGKDVIFAWFADKKAAMAWYHSPVHERLMGLMGGPRADHEPMADVPDDGGPILAIASLTRTEKPQIEGVPFPISQIAIELYRPVNGGLSMGGRFAPEKMEIPKPKAAAKVEPR